MCCKHIDFNSPQILWHNYPMYMRKGKAISLVCCLSADLDIQASKKLVSITNQLVRSRKNWLSVHREFHQLIPKHDTCKIYVNSYLTDKSLRSTLLWLNVKELMLVVSMYKITSKVEDAAPLYSQFPVPTYTVQLQIFMVQNFREITKIT